MPTLLGFQRHDVDTIKRARLRVIVASAPGTGKTPIAVRSVAESWKWALPCLVIAPASVTHNWAREFSRWGRGLKVQILEGTDSKPDKKAQVYIASWAIIEPRLRQLQQLKLRSIVADEAHMVKNPDTQRSQALFALTRDPTQGLLLLTGTPIVNAKSELRVLQELYGTQRPLMIRRLLEDVVDVPEKKRSYVNLLLPKKALEEYAKAEDDFETWLRKEKERLLGEGRAEAAVESAMNAEAFTRVGYLRRLVGESKVPAAAEWIYRAALMGEPVVVFLEHQTVLKELTRRLKKTRIRFRVIEGSTSAKRRQEYIDSFQKHEYPVIICTKAGKEGITLHSARHLLFVERFFTSADEEQAEDRIRRIGQAHKTTIWYLHAPDTIDDRMDEIVKEKRKLINKTIRGERSVETPEDNVRSLIRSWSAWTGPETKRTLKRLGHATLVQLPAATKIHGIVFSRKRWSAKQARIWCKMHGYPVVKVHKKPKSIKLVLKDLSYFQPRTFTFFRACEDVKIISGKRLGKRNNSRLRRRDASQRR